MLLLALCLLRHTFWRDESEAWLIARSSRNLPELIANTRYEGHPPLWHLLLYAITRFSWNPDWMKPLNLVLYGLASAMVLYCRRLPILFRACLPFTYFLLFEYGEIARNYLPGIVLLLFATLQIADGEGRLRRWCIPVALGLAALTSLHAMVISLALAAGYGLSLFESGAPEGEAPNRRGIVGRVAGMAFVLFCAALSAALIKPPADSGVMVGNAPIGRVAALVAAGKFFAKAYLPLPVFHTMFWNESYYDEQPHHLGIGVDLAGWGLFVLFSVAFFNSGARRFFVLGSAALIGVMVVSQRNFMRHVGWLFVCFLLAMVLDGRLGRIPGWKSLLLSAMLAVQLLAGLFAAALGLKYPFSAAKQVANYLSDNQMEKAPLVFEPDYVGLSVEAYLHSVDEYSIEEGRPISFTMWDRREALNQHIPSREELDAIAPHGPKPVLITAKPLKAQQIKRAQVAELAHFESRINEFDAYYIYR